MPRTYAKKSRKKNARRRPRNRRRRVNNANYMGFVSGMPKVRRAYLRYADTVSLTSTVGALGLYQFRANSVQDPDLTSTGHQPMGYDQWAALYNHYVVVGAKITIKSLATAQVAPYGAIMGCYISDDTSFPYSTPDGFIESKRGSWRTLTQQRNAVSFTTKFSSKRFFNVTDIKDNLSRLGATVSGNPSDVAIFNIWYADLNNNSTSQLAMVTIDFVVDFFEPKDMVQS